MNFIYREKANEEQIILNNLVDNILLNILNREHLCHVGVTFLNKTLLAHVYTLLLIEHNNLQELHFSINNLASHE